jgi:small subunit ribosomal protein S1
MNDESKPEEMTDPVQGPRETFLGTVTRVADDAVYVRLDDGREGKVPRSQWSGAGAFALHDAAEPDERVRVVVTEDGDPLLLSRKNAVDASTWAELQLRMQDETIFTTKMLTAVKGGLVADVDGVRAFVPASLVEHRQVGDLSAYVGKELPVVVTEADEADKKLILSHRRVLDKMAESERKNRLLELEVGQRVEGVVARMSGFGAFIDLGGVDGLLHVSEISWSRVNRPEDVLKVGQPVTVRILGVDPEAGKVSLSMKEDRESPWSGVENRFAIGDVVEGTVRRLADFGAFVELAPGVEGLVHVSQIANRRVDKPSDVLSPGQQVQVKILDIRPAEGRISLSMRDALRTEDRRKAAQWVEQNTTDSGATIGELFGDLLRKKFK